MRGRYPAGVEYVDQLDAAPQDKERLKAILQTLAGEARVQEACARLGIRETRFHQLRERALRGALEAIARRPAGRPGQPAAVPAERVRELEAALAAKERELQQAQVREEVALILARDQASAARAEKKTRRRGARPRRQPPR